MATQRYTVTPQPIDTLLAWVKSGEIAIPEIQRPFVWEATGVRNLLDSLYRGYPVGYLIAWRNPNVRLKDGTTSSGKRILIDGQQRVTALMASLLGREVLNKDYETVRIRIAFHPVEQRFEVANPAIRKDVTWIQDVAEVFSPNVKLLQLTREYCEKNPNVSPDDLFATLEQLRKIVNNHVGIIELADDLDIETVAEIFVRVNSAGAPLSQADFAMSKIAVNEKHGGNVLRKAIDYFCHLSVAPQFYSLIEKNDEAFAKSDYFSTMRWLKNENEDIYDPSYTDLLRVSFTTEFQRGKMQDLVALLSGRNFETKQFEEAIVEDSFARLSASIKKFMNETNFKNLIMILRSAGFVDSSMISSQNAINFAYILYLTQLAKGESRGSIARLVQRWFVFSVLTGRYSASPESTIDYDIRQIHAQGAEAYGESLIKGELSDTFWSAGLVQEMDTSVASSPYFRLFQAAQIKAGDKGFLSRDLTVRELVEVKSDVHHLFPKQYLKQSGLTRGQYNQIANYVVAQTEINIAIGKKEPATYIRQCFEQCERVKARYGNIVDLDELKENFKMNCVPADIAEFDSNSYSDFLAKRRSLMAAKIKKYFEGL